MSDVTDDDLQRWERLCEAAKAGGWDGVSYAHFVAFSRDALPLLIAEVRRLRAELDQRPADRSQLIVDDLREIAERYGSGGVHFVLPSSGCSR